MACINNPSPRALSSRLISGLRHRIEYKLGGLILRLIESRLHSSKHESGDLIIGRDVDGINHAFFEGKNVIGRRAKFSQEVRIGYATTIGTDSILHGPLRIGNYCQLAPRVGIYGKNHPTSYASIYVNKNLFAGRLKDNSQIQSVSIGHDVWIGHGAIVLKGVEVGNGAIIGAGAVVTSSVPDYAIVVGNPARLLKMRFSDDVIELLKRFEWWTMKTDELAEYEHVFQVDFIKETAKALLLLREALRLKGMCAEKKHIEQVSKSRNSQ